MNRFKISRKSSTSSSSFTVKGDASKIIGKLNISGEVRVKASGIKSCNKKLIVKKIQLMSEYLKKNDSVSVDQAQINSILDATE